MTDINDTTDTAETPERDPRLRGMPEQLTREDLAAMTPDEITAAHDAGQTRVLLGTNQEDLELIHLAENFPGFEITPDQIKRLAELNRHDLIANLPIKR